LKAIRERIAELEEILASEKKLKSVIVSELRDVQKSFGDDRRTQIVDKVDEIKLEDGRRHRDADHGEPCRLHQATSTDTYRHQSRGGKGRIGAKTKGRLRRTSLYRLAHITFYCSLPRAVSTWLKVYELPEAAAATPEKPSSTGENCKKTS
jgi:DNA gyrase subunit A